MNRELMEYLAAMELRLMEAINPPSRKYRSTDPETILSLSSWRREFRIPEIAIAHLVKSEQIKVIRYSNKSSAKRMFKRTEIAKFFTPLTDEQIDALHDFDD